MPNLETIEQIANHPATITAAASGGGGIIYVLQKMKNDGSAEKFYYVICCLMVGALFGPFVIDFYGVEKKSWMIAIGGLSGLIGLSVASILIDAIAKWGSQLKEYPLIQSILDRLLTFFPKKGS